MAAYANFKAFCHPIYSLIWVWVFFGVVSVNLVFANDFKVTSIQGQLTNNVLTLAGSLDLTLTPKVEEALNNGIPLAFNIEIKLYRRRAFLWDELSADWSLRRQLRYHALSGQYLASGEPALASVREGFNSLTEALAQIGSLTGVNLSLMDPAVHEADYRIRVRVALDIEALPSLLRPVAYTSRAWNLDSGWSVWKVQP